MLVISEHVIIILTLFSILEDVMPYMFYIAPRRTVVSIRFIIVYKLWRQVWIIQNVAVKTWKLNIVLTLVIPLCLSSDRFSLEGNNTYLVDI